MPYPSFSQHVNGARHARLLKKHPEWKPDDKATPPTIPDDFVRCEACNISFPSIFQSSHQTGFKHRKKERFFSIQAAFEEADKDKHGIEVDGDMDFGFIETDNASLTHKRHLDIRLTTREKVVISEVRLSSNKSQARTHSRYVAFLKVALILVKNRLVFL